MLFKSYLDLNDIELEGNSDVIGMHDVLEHMSNKWVMYSNYGVEGDYTIGYRLEHTIDPNHGGMDTIVYVRFEEDSKGYKPDITIDLYSEWDYILDDVERSKEGDIIRKYVKAGEIALDNYFKKGKG